MTNPHDPNKPDEIRQIEAIYDTDYQVGQDNVSAMGMDLHHPVLPSVLR